MEGSIADSEAGFAALLEKARTAFSGYVGKSSVYSRIKDIPADARPSQIPEIQRQDKEWTEYIEHAGILNPTDRKRLARVFVDRYADSKVKPNEASVEGGTTDAIIFRLQDTDTSPTIRVKFAYNHDGICETWKNNHFDNRLNGQGIGYSVDRDWGPFYVVSIEGDLSLAECFRSAFSSSAMKAWREYIAEYSLNNIITNPRRHQAKLSVLSLQDALLRLVHRLPPERASELEKKVNEAATGVLELTQDYERVCPIDTDSKMSNYILVSDTPINLRDSNIAISGKNVAKTDMGWKQATIESAVVSEKLPEYTSLDPYLGLPHMYLGTFYEDVCADTGLRRIAGELKDTLMHFIETKTWKINGTEVGASWKPELARRAFWFGRMYWRVLRESKSHLAQKYTDSGFDEILTP